MIESKKSSIGVSAVIGVILIVAVVVALVALISIAVFDITDNAPQEETSKASVQVSSTQGSGITVQMIDKEDTSEVVVETAGGEQTISETGETVTVDSFGEQVNVISVGDKGSRSVIRSVDPTQSESTTSDDNTTFVDPESSTTAGNIDGNAYNTLEAAENAVSAGDSIIIRSGVHRDPGTVQATVDKEVTIGVQDNVVFECDASANNGNVNLNFTRTPAVVNGAQNIATRGCGNAELPPPLEDQFSVSLDDLTVASGSQATFSADISDIGQDDIKSITWDFGDGAGETGNPVTHTYSNTGDYTATVEVTSKEGTTESAIATYNVESSPSNIAPVAAFNYSPVGPTVNQRVEFNASSSSDQDGSVDSYNWDLDDDGSFESSGLTASKIYNSTGEKNVRLQVVDKNGNIDETVRSVLVDSTGDVNPEFSINFSDRTIPVNEDALFSANISDIGVSQVQNVNWIFGDGSTSTGNPATNTYSSIGDYTATVEVTSKRGVTNSDTAAVTVISNPPSEEIHPRPTVSITPENPVTGEQVLFDASTSQDIDGVITEYEWDLNNDGIFEESGSSVTRSYDYVAEQDVRLKVTDNDGNTNTTVSSVLISSDSDSRNNDDPTLNDDPNSCGCVYSGGGSSDGTTITGVVEVNPKIQGAVVRSIDTNDGSVIDTGVTDENGEYAVDVEESSDEIRVVTDGDETLNGREFHASAERQVADRVAVNFNFTDTVNSTVDGTDVTVAYSVRQENTYKQVGTPYEVQAMSEDLDETYRVIRDIDMSETSSWNSGTGFKPIAAGAGNPTGNGDEFEGDIKGENHKLSGLYVDRQDIGVGLISQAYGASVSNMELTNVDITHDSTLSNPVSECGSLIGTAGSTTIENVKVTGSVNSQVAVQTGGVAGRITDTLVDNVNSTVDVTGYGDTGGLVGSGFSGTIDKSSSSGSVTSNQGNAGGLVGHSRQTRMEVKRSYSTSDVTGEGESGGLIGFMQDGEISESFASGSVVSNNGDAGGLVGNASGTVLTGGYIEKSYAIGSVEGSEDSGGLVGSLEESSEIGYMQVRDSFATGSISDGSGGLVGSYAGSDVQDSYWDVESTGAASSDGGTGLITSDMQGYTPSPIGEDSMAGLNFDQTWETITGNYPILTSIDAQKQIELRGSPISTFAFYDPELYFPLKEDSGDKAYNQGSLQVEGSVGSEVVLGVDGILGTTAYRFNGNDAPSTGVDLGDLDVVEGGSATALAWIKVDEFNAGTSRGGHFSSTHGQIIGKQGGNSGSGSYDDNYELGVLDDGSVGWYAEAGGTQESIEGGSVSKGSWHMIAGTYDKSDGDMKLYVDGNLVNSDSIDSGGIISNNNPVGIGYSAEPNYSSYRFTFDGDISYAYLWDHRLTSSEIQLIYDKMSN